MDHFVNKENLSAHLNSTVQKSSSLCFFPHFSIRERFNWIKPVTCTRSSTYDISLPVSHQVRCREEEAVKEEAKADRTRTLKLRLGPCIASERGRARDCVSIHCLRLSSPSAPRSTWLFNLLSVVLCSLVGGQLLYSRPVLVLLALSQPRRFAQFFRSLCLRLRLRLGLLAVSGLLFKCVKLHHSDREDFKSRQKNKHYLQLLRPAGALPMLLSDFWFPAVFKVPLTKNFTPLRPLSEFVKDSFFFSFRQTLVACIGLNFLFIVSLTIFVSSCI